MAPTQQEHVPRVTVSVGVASTEASAVGSVSELVARADNALHEAKRPGRNGVRIDAPR